MMSFDDAFGYLDELAIAMADEACGGLIEAGLLDEVLLAGGLVLAGGLALADRYLRRNGRKLQRGVYIELMPVNGDYESPEELSKLAAELRLLADEVESLL